MTARPLIRILLVEDNPTDVLLLKDALAESSDFDTELVQVSKLEDAIGCLAQSRYDIVLLDLGLPDSQGVETFVRLHSQAFGVPVLVLTALEDEKVGVNAMQAGAQDFLVKQRIKPRVMLRSMRYAIERHRFAAELERRADELEKSEERFELAVEGAAAGLWDWDPQAGTTYFAPRFRELLGFGAADAFPVSMHEFMETVHPEDCERVLNCRNDHLQRRVPYDVEYRVQTKSGDYVWVQCRGQALWDENGQAYRMLGWIIDMTERKQAEEALSRSHERLRRLATRIESVREEERTRLSREVHDNLGQLLTGLKMDLRWIGRRLDEPWDATRKEAVGSRLAAAEALVDETIGTVQRIAVELRPGVLDQLGVVEAMRDELRRFQQRTGLAVRADLPAYSVKLAEATATAFFRILQELLTNVSRHAGAGEVAVVLQVDPADERFIMLSVADDGCGFALDQASRPAALGLLGMSERAGSCGGSLAINSHPGEGTTVSVRIPRT